MNRRFLRNASVFLSLALNANLGVAKDGSAVPSEAVNADSQTTAAVLEIGSPAASLSIEHWLSNADGRFAPVTDFKTGKVYVIEFWATWCVPCIGCMPHLAEMQTKYQDRNVQVISVSDQSRKTVEKFLALAYQPKDDKENDGSKSTPKTYSELTSVYCLTTDPDASVYNDYHLAAGRRGIPSAFIVGKSGLIEWMGHPMAMDKPLEMVVNDSWDRAAFASGYFSKQRRDVMVSRISKMVRSGQPEAAEKAIDRALLEFADDSVAITEIEKQKAYLITTPIYDSLDEDDNVQALALIEKLLPSVSKKAQRQLLLIQAKLQIKESQYDAAAKTLALVANDESFEATELARVVREIHSISKRKKYFPQSLFDHCVELAQIAVDHDGDNSHYLNTLALMQQTTGDIDAAIKTQTIAVTKSDGRNKGIQVLLDQYKAEKALKGKMESK